MKIYEAKTIFSCVCEEALGDLLNRPENVVAYMKGAFDSHPMQESFWVLFLNRKARITGRQMITLGTATAVLAHPREVLRAAILAGCTDFICVHNHPSGDPAPSAPDLHFTRMIREAAKAVDICFADHVIIGQADCDPRGLGYFSFREAGMI